MLAQELAGQLEEDRSNSGAFLEGLAAEQSASLEELQSKVRVPSALCTIRSTAPRALKQTRDVIFYHTYLRAPLPPPLNIGACVLQYQLFADERP